MKRDETRGSQQTGAGRKHRYSVRRNAVPDEQPRQRLTNDAIQVCIDQAFVLASSHHWEAFYHPARARAGMAS